MPVKTETKDIELRNAGLKVTAPRIKILEILQNSENHHLTAETIHQRLHEAKIDVGFATVYRVLMHFEQVGLVSRHYFESGHSVFELNQGAHHDHLVCNQCGVVEEFVDLIIEERQAMIAEKAGFEMQGHALNIYGLCSACQGKK